MTDPEKQQERMKEEYEMINFYHLSHHLLEMDCDMRWEILKYGEWLI